jgi:hypothetical protein
MIFFAWLFAGATIWYLFVQWGLKFAALEESDWTPRPTEGVSGRPKVIPFRTRHENASARSVTLKAA